MIGVDLQFVIEDRAGPGEVEIAMVGQVDDGLVVASLVVGEVGAELIPEHAPREPCTARFIVGNSSFFIPLKRDERYLRGVPCVEAGVASLGGTAAGLRLADWVARAVAPTAEAGDAGYRRRLQARYPGGWARTAPLMEPLRPPLAVFARYQRLRQVLASKSR